MTTKSPITEGVHHVGLSVPDVAVTSRFFIDALGFSQVGEVPDYPAVFVSDGVAMVTLWQVSEPATATPFDRHQNVGLHHLAFRVDADALDNLASALANRDDVLIEFAPSALRDGPTRHMMCRIPGNVRVEFIAPVAA